MIAKTDSLIRRILQENWRPLGVASLMFVLHQLAEAMVPVAIGVIVDHAISPGDVRALLYSLLGLALLFLVLSAMWRYGVRILVKAESGAGHRLRVALAGRLVSSQEAQTGRSQGELLSISSNDADQSVSPLALIPRICACLAAVVVSAIVLLIINVPLGLIVLLGTPVVVLSLHFASPVVTRRASARQHTAGLASAVAVDLVSGLRPLRGLGAQLSASRRFERMSRESLASSLSAAKVRRGFETISMTVSNLLAVGIGLCALWFTVRGEISIGELIMVVGLAQFLIEPLSILTSVPALFAVVRASSARVHEVLNAPVDDGQNAQKQAQPEEGADSTEVCLRIREGEMLGIVTEDPSMAQKVVEAFSHQDHFSSHGLRIEFDDASAGSEGNLVEPHLVDLFTGTIRSNIITPGQEAAEAEKVSAKQALPPVDQQRLERVLHAAQCESVITERALGMDAPVQERGSNFSGGERQRLALARALYQDPKILVLQDPTSAIDSLTEQRIAQGIRRTRHEQARRTSVLLSNSPALLKQSSRVIFLGQDGSFLQGEHHELLTTHERYRRTVLA